GINLGAFLGPLVTGWLGEGHNWHWGFGAAGVGMIFGLIQYKAGLKYLGDAGLPKVKDSAEVLAARSRRFFTTVGVALLAVAAFAYLVYSGTIPITIPQVAQWLGYSVLAMVFLYFIFIWSAGGHTPDENKKMGVIFWLFLLVAIFWSGFEQA